MNKNKEDISFGELFEEWYDYHIAAIAKSTAYGYSRRWRRVEGFYGYILVKDLDAEKLQAFIKYLLGI